jgi:hypothetical protein
MNQYDGWMSRERLIGILYNEIRTPQLYKRAEAEVCREFDKLHLRITELEDENRKLKDVVTAALEP